MSKDMVHMSREKSRRELLTEVVGQVHGSVNTFKCDEITFYPFSKCEVSNIHVSGASSRFVGICHGSSSIIIFVEE